MKKEEIKKLITPKNDIVFKRLFGKVGNERLVKDFLEAVLDVEIESVTLGKELELVPERIDEKLGILDVLVELCDGTKVNIEMQRMNAGDVEKRFTYYQDRLYVGGLKRGEDYSNLKRAIVIGILDYVHFEDIEDYHTIWKQTEQKHKERTFEQQEIHLIELPKFLKSKVDTDRKVDQWLLFIDYSRRELIEMAKEKNEVVGEAEKEYEYLTGEEEIQRLTFLKMKYEWDYNSGIKYAADKALEKGRAEGKEEGIAEGKAEALLEEKVRTAKKMMEKGMNVKLIEEITGLSREEIKKLK